jgi:hypothetical protein
VNSCGEAYEPEKVDGAVVCEYTGIENRYPPDIPLCYVPGNVPVRNTFDGTSPYFCVNGTSAVMYSPFHPDEPESTDPDPNPNMQCDDGMLLVRNSSSNLVCTDLVPPSSTPGGGCPDGSFSDAGGDVCYVDPDKPTTGTIGTGTDPTGSGTTGTGTEPTGTDPAGTGTTGTGTTGTGTTGTGTTCPSGQLADPLHPGGCVDPGLTTSPCVLDATAPACDSPPVVRIAALPAQPTTTTTTGGPPNQPTPAPPTTTSSTRATPVSTTASQSKGTSTHGRSGGHEKSGSRQSSSGARQDSTDETSDRPTKKQPVTTKASPSAEDAEKSAGSER